MKFGLMGRLSRILRGAVTAQVPHDMAAQVVDRTGADDRVVREVDVPGAVAEGEVGAESGHVRINLPSEPRRGRAP